MALFIPVNKKTKQEYEPIQAKDKKDAKLVWNTKFEGFHGKYDFKEVPETNRNVPVVQRQERKAPIEE